MSQLSAPQSYTNPVGPKKKSSGTEMATQANRHNRMVSNKPIPCSKGPSKHVEGHAY